jgi:signal transduction histidine kinase
MSVRVRVTAVAMLVTALALALGGWGMLRSIESTQLGQIAADADHRLDLIAERLEAGDPAEEVLAGAPAPGSLVQILDEEGDILTTSAGGTSDPLLVVSGTASAGAPSTDVLAGGGVYVSSYDGAARVERPLPGTAGIAIPIELRWERVVTDTGEFTIATASPLEEVTRSLDAVRRSLWFGLPLVVVLMGTVAWFVTGRALHPVEAMRLEAEAITHTTLHRRVPEPASADEVGRLARTLNAMLDRLEGAADAQRRFVADASHELRTPVATLRTELEVAQRAGDEASLRRAVEGALGEEQRLEALLADLLLLASVDDAPAAGGEAVDLVALATAEAERPRRVPITVTGSGTVPGRRRQLEQVVRNLLDNAARHAAAAVSVAVDGGHLVVDDDGPGVAPADRRRIFERFTRLDEGRARDDGGAGLGLSIVEAVVRAHGGTVEVADAPELGGARVAVQLPVA